MTMGYDGNEREENRREHLPVASEQEAVAREIEADQTAQDMSTELRDCDEDQAADSMPRIPAQRDRRSHRASTGYDNDDTRPGARGRPTGPPR